MHSDYVEGDDGRNILWVDRTGPSTDSVAGVTSNDKVQYVTGFANGADRTLDGDRLADPTVMPGHTYKMFSGNPLFSSAGPQASDIRQGALGDCWLMAGLGAIANDDAFALRQNVVDFDDGTYGVRLGRTTSTGWTMTCRWPAPRHHSRCTPTSGRRTACGQPSWRRPMPSTGPVANSYASIEGGWPVTSTGRSAPPSPATGRSTATPTPPPWPTTSSTTGTATMP